MATTDAASRITISDTHPSDALYQIECQAHPLPWSNKVFMQSDGPQYRWRLLQVGEQWIAFALTQLVADELTLHNIAVLPEYRGQRYGDQLLLDVLAYAEHTHSTVFLEVRASNSPAIGLYEKHGFTTIGRRPNYYPTATGAEDALVMRWQAKEVL